jgi:glycerol-3-phosphate dehydrogenase
MTPVGPILDVRTLSTTRFDVLVIGGGVHGCGIARDAALRGLKVALLEQGDFASATSMATSKLVHGGLRYLEHFQLRLVRESLRERETLLRIAPHLVRPLPFLVPIYDEGPRGRLTVAAGLTLYDLLARGGSLPRHRRLSKAECLQLEPRLRPAGLRGGFLYHDAQMNDARLVLENALDARRHGGQVWNHVRVESLLQRQGRVHGVAARDARTGQRFEVEAALVVNASGPWFAQIHEQQQLTKPTPVRLSRGSHIVVPRLGQGHGLLLSARSDERVFFVLPWKGNTLVGTTEIEHTGSLHDVHASEEEISYLLGELAEHLTGDLPGRDEVLASFAGVRALPHATGKDLGDISRRALVRLDAPGMLGVLGGKYTTYRAVSELVVDEAQRILERSRPGGCETAQRHLPGGDIPDMNQYFAVAEKILTTKYDMAPQVLRYLLGTYGTRHTELLQLIEDDPSRAEFVEPELPFLRAEVVFAVQSELARDLDDVLWRRTYRGYLGELSASARSAWEDAFRHALDATRSLPA